jgi:hypothetical protein
MHLALSSDADQQDIHLGVDVRSNAVPDREVQEIDIQVRATRRPGNGLGRVPGQGSHVDGHYPTQGGFIGRSEVLNEMGPAGRVTTLWLKHGASETSFRCVVSDRC